MNWITRERSKIDRIACPWLIKRLIDPDAHIFYVPFDQVKIKAVELDATPFDIPDTKFTHYEDRCTFDFFLERYELEDPALKDMAMIIRGADTDDHSLASQSSGLWAISARLAHNITDDQQLLEKGMLIYDALYSWATHLQNQSTRKAQRKNSCCLYSIPIWTNKSPKSSKPRNGPKSSKRLFRTRSTQT